MGLAHIESAVYSTYGQGLDEEGEPFKLSFERFPVCGFVTTFSLNSFITDSAAAGTALAAGVKTNNGMLGVTPDGNPTETLAELAKKKGKAVGLVSSVGVNHATPAVFYAHVESRNEYNKIGDQFFAGGVVDVIMGGGIYGDKWTDEQILESATQAGYRVFNCQNYHELNPETEYMERVFGYFDVNNNKQLDYESTRGPSNIEPHLSDITLKTLEILKHNKKGFFLMVEGGSIDWASHGNDFEPCKGEVLEFDRTVSRTLEFLERENLLRHTLIVVTADHETGGMSMTGPYQQPLLQGDEPEIKWTSGNHTAAAVPIWATGPGAAPLNGKHDNTFIFETLAAALGHATPARPK